jgi:hypothetical protein
MAATLEDSGTMLRSKSGFKVFPSRVLPPANQHQRHAGTGSPAVGAPLWPCELRAARFDAAFSTCIMVVELGENLLRVCHVQ